MEQLLSGRELQGALLFPFPTRDCDRRALNLWMFCETGPRSGDGIRSLAIAGPDDDPSDFARWMEDGHCIGLKPYPHYARCRESFQAGIEEFAPEWMWALCERHSGVLMLHLARDAGVSDSGNRETLLRLSGKYPGCKVVLAHIARSFNYRTARGLRHFERLPNVFVDTSSITEPEGMRMAIEFLGPQRVLFGSDFPVSHLRGHCSTAGVTFHWFYADEIKKPGLTLVGIESLLSLRLACEQTGLGSAEIARIFSGNAKNLLGLGPLEDASEVAI
jgi:glutamate-1-semialdehyde 2,1-aminomutase